jgi:hypothetical protein
VPFSWRHSETGHCHDGSANIKSPQGDGPLESADE